MTQTETTTDPAQTERDDVPVYDAPAVDAPANPYARPARGEPMVRGE
ncbi:hypothetical protein [Streptomyces sp. NBC_00239]|nr:hypothetical protein [Streptomyces sp. NBC_00239]